VAEERLELREILAPQRPHVRHRPPSRSPVAVGYGTLPRTGEEGACGSEAK
jgi:hypothetical protein